MCQSPTSKRNEKYMLSAFKKLNYIIEHYNKGMQKLYSEVLRKNEQDVKNDTFTKRRLSLKKKKKKVKLSSS